MNKWYKSSVMKGLLILIAIVSAMSGIISLLIISTYSVSTKEIWNKKPKEYTESKEFENQMCRATMEVLNWIQYEECFETEGKYDPEKWIDVTQYSSGRRNEFKKQSGLKYRLSDLEQWSMEYGEGDEIIVCQQEDGTYYYYYKEEFLKLLKERKLIINMDGYTSEELVSELQNGSLSMEQIAGHSILDEKKTLKYQDFWTFNEAIEEEAKPEGGNNILEVVNKTSELNGKLSETYSDLETTLASLYFDVQNYKAGGEWTEGNTNFAYILADKENNKVYTNRKAYQDYNSVRENVSEIQKNAKYIIVQSKLSDFKTNMNSIAASNWKEFIQTQWSNGSKDFIFVAAVDEDFPIQDVFYLDKKLYDEYAPYINSASVVLGVSVFLIIFSFVWLTVVAGRKNGTEEIRLNAFDRWKTELAAVFVIGVWFIPMMFWSSNATMVSNYFSNTTDLMAAAIGYSYEYSSGYIPTEEDLIVLSGAAAYTMIFFLIGYLSLVRRIKAGEVWKNSVLRALIKGFLVFWNHRNVVGRTAVAVAAVIGVHWILVLSHNMILAILVLVLDGALLCYSVLNGLAKDKIARGIQRMAEGDLEYQIPLEHLRGEQLKIAERLNDIGSVLQKAVEKSVKSERLKTDLITNVSHDIKTPLTSIINYVDILKREKIEDPKIQGYLEILEAKAQRLKTLTEDVVEASKVSSGNISLERMDVNLVEMINQTAGEFAEKFEHKNLELIQTLPDEPAIIHVDGRRMWRVLENIYNNAAKYAMPGTRIYAGLRIDQEEVVFFLKNISEYPLNFSADELTERFIRGDVSRSTEGSGLGLSIAKSLVQMQGGKLELYLDGDLFKVTIRFPKVEKKDPCFFREEEE